MRPPKYNYKNMAEILQPKQVGVAKLVPFTVEQGSLLQYKLRTPPNDYMRLIVNGELMMSDTLMERVSSTVFLDKAHGDVLVAGLGLGMILVALENNPDIKSVTVIEKYQDVIDAVWPQLNLPEDKFRVICADALTYEPDKKYNYIFLDIWPEYGRDVYELEMRPQKRRYRKYLVSRKDDPKVGIDCWAYDKSRDSRPIAY